MEKPGTRLLSGTDVVELLTAEECIQAVETAFRMHAGGKASPPGILGMHAGTGGFHIKAGIMALNRNYFVAKTNANFPANTKEFGLPTIQGIVVVCDAANGRLLALMDSIKITVLRTGAATAVAAKYLSKAGSKVLAICGCGEQGAISLQMLMKVRRLEQVFVYDKDREAADRFAAIYSRQLDIPVTAAGQPGDAVMQSDICVTCTPSKTPYLAPEMVSPGTFVAAVGADSEDKTELFPKILAANKLITDLTSQCEKIGELHHAILAGIMDSSQVHAELGEVIIGRKPGRESEDEIIVFDSTGMALQDVAAAAIVYEKAENHGIEFNFNG